MKRIPFAFTAVTIIASAAPAFAQSADSSGNDRRDQFEIVVTAQKRSENVQKIPISIAAITSEQLKSQQVASIADVARMTPGIKFAEFSGAGNISIRGVGTALVSGNGEGSVAAHIDGVYVSQTQALVLGQDDIGRVEVLRGPQGSLYGRNSTGGVVNFISAEPTNSFGGDLSALFGNYDRTRVKGVINAPLSDGLRVRVSGVYDRRDGWATNLYTGHKIDQSEAFGGKLAIDADVSSNWESQLRVTYRHEKDGEPYFDSYDPAFAAFPGFSVNPAYGPREIRSALDPDERKKFLLVSFRNAIDLGGAKLVSTTGYTRFDLAGFYDGASTLIANPFAGGALVAPFALHRQTHTRDFSQEFNLSGQTSKLDWLAGAYYYHGTIRVATYTDFSGLRQLKDILFGGFAVGDNINDQHSRRQNFSLFGDVTYHVSDRARVYGGARVLREEYDNYLDQFDQNGNFSCTYHGPNALTQKYRKTALTGRAGLQYDVADNAMAYAQYARGFKGGGFAASTCGNAYAEETIDAVEGGVKFTLPGGLGLLNAAAFYYSMHNVQLEQATVVGIPLVNAPRAAVFGLEASTQISPVGSLLLSGSIQYLDAKYKRFINNDPAFLIPVGTSLAGVRMINAPEFSGNVAIENTFKLSPTVSLKLRGDAELTSKYNFREFNVSYVTQPGYVLLNAFATLDVGDKLTFRAFGKNLTNRAILAGAIGFLGGGLGAWQPPRTYGVEATVRF